MSGYAVITRSLENPAVYQQVSALATGHLVANGDTGVVVKGIDHDVGESSGHATVTNVDFESDAGTAILVVALFSNGTASFQEM